jgi:hypothetical protein
MKHSSDFYKVINAVINTLNHGEAVVYVSGGQGGSGEGMFDCNEDNDKVRNSLLKFAHCEELDEDELLSDWSEEVLTGARKSGFDFWQLSGYGDNAPCLQILINPDYYITSSYDLRDMICDEQDLEAAEITTGMNGYPRGLRGAVLLGGCGKTIEQMQELADMYGVKLVSLHQRDGWHLWEYKEWMCELYDYVAFVEQHNDNLHYWESYKAYAEELREYAADTEDEKREDFLAEAERVEGWQLEKNEVLCAPNGYPYLLLDDVEKVDRMVDCFSYDTHNYTLALDCMIEE